MPCVHDSRRLRLLHSRLRDPCDAPKVEFHPTRGKGFECFAVHVRRCIASVLSADIIANGDSTIGPLFSYNMRA